MDHVEATNAAAREKAGMPEDWATYLWEYVTGGLLVTGCRTRPKKSGPNKGQPKYLTKQDNHRVLVTKADVERHMPESSAGSA